MVDRKPHFLVTLESSDQFRKELWNGKGGLRLPGKHGWVLATNDGGGFLIQKRGTKSTAPIFISPDEAKQGVALPFTSEGQEVTLKIKSVDRAFGRWLNPSASDAAGSGTDLMILCGNGSSLDSTELVDQFFVAKTPLASLFRVELSDTMIHIGNVHLEVNATLFDQPIAIKALPSLSLDEWDGVILRYRNLWWKFRLVKAPAELKATYPRLLFAAATACAIGLLVSLPVLTPRLSQLLRHDQVIKFDVAPPTGKLVIERVEPVEPPPPVETVPPPPTVAEEKPIPVEKPTELPKPAEKVAVREAPDATQKAIAKAEARELRAAQAAAAQALAAKQTLDKEVADLRNQMKRFSPSSANNVTANSKAAASELDPAPVLVPQELSVAEQKDTASEKNLEMDVKALPVLNPGPTRKITEEDEARESLKMAAANVSRDTDNEKFVVIGGLTPAQIEQAVTKNIDSVRGCYESALMRKSGQQGKVILSFLVGKTGIVEGARVAESSIADAGLSKCLVTQSRRWEFPKPRNGEVVNVSYPFEFKSFGVN